nr:GspH/FimT family protein [Azoarcus sp. L1K30]
MSLASAANEVSAALQQARMEAIRRNRRVSFQLDTNRQWTVYVDTNADGAYDSDDDITDSSDTNFPNPIKQGSYGDRVATVGANVNVTFTGLGNGSSATICLKVSGHSVSKKITLEPSGRPMLETKGTDCS